ncbi:MAG: T9SS type A sorting domain-containing protein [Ignavibacteriae bacterium]|nr:T9SS type A sorting domain-containing protein [Ignavibacteriota bacterium]
MKKVFLLSLLMTVTLLAFDFQSPQVLNNVVVEFISTNQYGNNLYIDNFSIGERYQNDIAVSSINNINRDTSYSSNGASPFSVNPNVSFINLGQTNVTSAFNVTMQITPGTYTSTKSIASLGAGLKTNVVFDPVLISPNTNYSIKVISSYGADQNQANDTLKQNTYYKPGGKKNVLFQNFTSSTCSWCAVFNPAMDAFIVQKFDTLVAIKYHLNFPSPGDPMYLANTVQNLARQNYYAVTGIPVAFADGVTQFGGYTLASLPVPYNERLSKGSPMDLTVTDTRVAGDSIKANITMNIYSTLPAGTYYLRVEAVERHIHYATPPGSNGEMEFYDVFRRAYPTTDGFSAPTAVGTYNYSVTYKRESNWIDSMMYTSVYVQNTTTKEVMNAGKARHYALDNISASNTVLNSKAPVAINNSYPGIISGENNDNVMAGFNYETFESGFPPAGWTIINPDNSYTFEYSSVANGPSIPGLKCVKINWMDYAALGQLDYMKTKAYNNIDLSDSLKFDWAYSYNGYNDRLQVKVSLDGGTTFPYTVFDKMASTLATAPATNDPFVPANDSQWGKFKIRLGDVITSIHQIGSETPTVYALNQNYPNPFNPVTNISYNLPKSSKVSLKVYDIKGQLVSTLFEGNQNTGIYITQFDGSKLASGVYFYKLEAGDYKEVRKMTLIK